MKLTDKQVKALRILATTTYETPMTSRTFARRMWPDSSGWRTLSDVRNGVVRGKAMPGLAGRWLWKLHLKGLVNERRPRHQPLWYISGAGLDALRERRSDEANALIDEWSRLYRAVNGKAPPFVSYTRGWFRIGTAPNAHRREEFEAMIETLESRYAQRRS